MASGMPKKLGNWASKAHTPVASGNAGSITGHHNGRGAYHTKVASGSVGSITQRTPDTTGRNFSTGLPKVSGGIAAHPSHINDLSAAVDKTTIRSVAGGLVKQSNGGTTITIEQPTDDHPFKVTLLGNGRAQMKVGSVFSYGSATCSIKQYFPTATPDFSIPRGGEFYLPADSKSAFSDDAVTISSDPKAGVFNFPTGSITNGRIVWMDASTSPPTLRCTETSTFLPTSGVPIAYIKEGGVKVQLHRDNIFIQPPLGLQASVTEEMVGAVKKFYLRVSAGHINNVIPTLDGNAISLPTTKKEIATVSKEVWLRCYRAAPPTKFPNGVIIELGDLNVMKNDTDAEAYIRLATYTFSPSGELGTVYNYLGGSLWGEAHKFNPSTASYYFYRI